MSASPPPPPPTAATVPHGGASFTGILTGAAPTPSGTGASTPQPPVIVSFLAASGNHNTNNNINNNSVNNDAVNSAYHHSQTTSSSGRNNWSTALPGGAVSASSSASGPQSSNAKRKSRNNISQLDDVAAASGSRRFSTNASILVNGRNAIPESEMPPSWLREQFLAFASKGIKSSDAPAVVQEKEMCIAMLMCTVMYVVLSLIIIRTQGVLQTITWVFDFVGLLVVYGDYVLKQRHNNIRSFMGFISVATPLLVLTDSVITHGCANTIVARGDWIVAQFLVAVFWSRMGGLPALGLGLALFQLSTNLIGFIVEEAVLNAEDSDTVHSDCLKFFEDNMRADAFTRTVFHVLIPMVMLAVYTCVAEHSRRQDEEIKAKLKAQAMRQSAMSKEAKRRRSRNPNNNSVMVLDPYLSSAVLSPRGGNNANSINLELSSSQRRQNSKLSASVTSKSDELLPGAIAGITISQVASSTSNQHQPTSSTNASVPTELKQVHTQEFTALAYPDEGEVNNAHTAVANDNDVPAANDPPQQEVDGVEHQQPNQNENDDDDDDGTVPVLDIPMGSTTVDASDDMQVPDATTKTNSLEMVPQSNSSVDGQQERSSGTHVGSQSAGNSSASTAHLEPIQLQTNSQHTAPFLPPERTKSNLSHNSNTSPRRGQSHRKLPRQKSGATLFQQHQHQGRQSSMVMRGPQQLSGFMLLVQLVRADLVPTEALQDTLRRYVSMVEKSVTFHDGQVVWSCGTELWCRFDTASAMLTTVTRLTRHLARHLYDFMPVMSVCFGDIIGATVMGRRGAHQKTIYVSTTPLLEHCRDLIVLATQLPAPVLVSEEVAAALPEDKVLESSSPTPNFKLKAFLISADADAESYDDTSSSASQESDRMSNLDSPEDPFLVGGLRTSSNILGDTSFSAGNDLGDIVLGGKSSAAPGKRSIVTELFSAFKSPFLSSNEEKESAAIDNASDSGSTSGEIFAFGGSRSRSNPRHTPTSLNPNNLLAAGAGSFGGSSMLATPTADPFQFSADQVDMDMSTTLKVHRVNRHRARLQRKRHSGFQQTTTNMQVWTMWRQCDLNGDGELSAEELWVLLSKLGLELTPEKYYEVLEALDRDGSCSISMEEFVLAYENHVLGGLVLATELKKAMTELGIRQDLDPVEAALVLWREFDTRGMGSMTPDEAVPMIAKLSVDTQPDSVAYMCREFESEGLLRMEDFVSLFAPVVSKEEADFAERKNAVERVVSMSDASSVSTQTRARTQEQVDQDEAQEFSHRFWHMVSPFLVLYILYNTFDVPLAIGVCQHDAYAETYLPRKSAELVIDGLFCMWFVTKFFLPREHQGRMLLSRRDIRANYLWSTEMIVDFFGALPLDLIGIALLSTPGEQCYFEVFRLNKLVLLYHFNAAFTMFTKDMAPSVVRITRTLLWWIIVSSTFASIFLLCLRFETDAEIVEMLGVKNFFDQSLVLVYAEAFDWALKTMVGLSRGPVIPDSDVLVVLSVLTVLAGVVAYSIIVATFIGALNVRDSNAIYQERVEDIVGFVNYTRMPPDAAQELFGFYKHMFKSFGATDLDYNPLMDLPQELVIRIQARQSLALLGNSPVFDGLDTNAAFISEIVAHMCPRVVMPGELLISKGSPATQMIVVTHGQLFVSDSELSSSRSPPRDEVLMRGDMYGGTGLIYAINSFANIRCHEKRYANVLVLQKEDFTSVSKYFPECLEIVQENVRLVLLQKLEHKFGLDGMRTDVLDMEEEVQRFLSACAVSEGNVAQIHRAVVDKLKESQKIMEASTIR